MHVSLITIKNVGVYMCMCIGGVFYEFWDRSERIGDVDSEAVHWMPRHNITQECLPWQCSWHHGGHRSKHLEIQYGPGIFKFYPNSYVHFFSENYRKIAFSHFFNLFIAWFLSFDSITESKLYILHCYTKFKFI